MTVIGQNRLKWTGNKLFYKDKLLVELLLHEKYEKHYHLKFYWREDKTPEFFNIVNARENARIYALQHLNYDMQESVGEARGCV